VAATKEITRLEKSSVNLSVTVPKEDVRQKYDEMLKEYSKNIQIAGFRKGKVPQHILEQKFGDALKQEAMGRIMESSLQEVFKEETLNRYERPLPYSTPEVKDEPKLDFEKDLKFSVVYDVLPEIKVNQWKGLTVEVPDGEVSKEDVDLELEQIRERNAIVMDRDENTPAQKGDVVTIDYCTLNEDGTEDENSRRKDFTFTLGSGLNQYQIDDDIAGMKKGETKDIEKKYGDDFIEKALAGQNIKIRVNLSTLKEKRLPDLDDELAQDVDEKFKTLQDLKINISDRLNKTLERRLKDLKITEILKKIMENSPAVLPESMLRVEIDARWRKLARNFGMSVEQIMAMMDRSGKAPEEIENEWRVAAEKALHSRLIVETLIDEQKIEVADDELEKEMEKMAIENDISVDEIKKNYEDSQTKEYFKEDIKERRLFDIMMTENTLKTGKKQKYLDLMTDNG
jgi:trigger factor